MKLATFNVENLFSRARVLNQDTWTDGKELLGEFSRLTERLQKAVYSDSDKVAILASLTKLGLKKKDETADVILRQNRQKLIKRPKSGPPQIVANGRGSWVGWLELKKEAVNEVATRMTGKVIAELEADVLAVIEAEDRIALKRFNEQLLRPADASFEQIMLIDGNDERGIDVGLLCNHGYAIDWMVSHVDDAKGTNRVFSRDCPEFYLKGPGGEEVLVLVNHFKSKGFGTAADSNARRRAQAERRPNACGKFMICGFPRATRTSRSSVI
jgi:hypothetical protein